MIDLDDGSTAEGHAVLLAVGPRLPGRATSGSSTTASRRPGPDAYPRDGAPAPRRRAVDRRRRGRARSSTRTRATTRASSPSGWRSARPSTPDYRALPRATYMDPEAASVGMSLGPGARGRARRVRVRRRRSRRPSKGYSVEAETGHVTIVVDRAIAPARRGGDGLPGRVRGDPRVRARDQGAGADRRPRRDDPRVPVDVADPQRAVRRGAGDARRPQPEPAGTSRGGPGLQPATTSPSTRTSRGRACHSAPPTSTGSASAAAGSTTRSARWPGHEPPAVVLARGQRRVDARGPERRATARSRCRGPSGGVARRPRRRGAGHGAGDARPRVDRLDGRVGAGRDQRPGPAIAPSA